MTPVVSDRTRPAPAQMPERPAPSLHHAGRGRFGVGPADPDSDGKTFQVGLPDSKLPEFA